MSAESSTSSLPPSLALLVALLVGACGTTVPATTTNPAFPPVLNVQNRGGPAFVVRINDRDVTTVACGSGATLTPAQGGVPELPWTLAVVRMRDGNVVLMASVMELPRWLVQIGDATVGALATVAVAGPPGPSCPPSPTLRD
jgi:hypothetical protein